MQQDWRAIEAGNDGLAGAKPSGIIVEANGGWGRTRKLPEFPKLVIAGIEDMLMENIYSDECRRESRTGLEARYAYYRRCQDLRRTGEQCKAPAEKGSQICHAHAVQKALAERRERERKAVLEEAAARMRKRGRPEFKVTELLTDFNGIQVTIAVLAQALIDGRIDCKTAGRLAVDLQTMSKLLWMAQRQSKYLITKNTKECNGSPQICADKRRLNNQKESPKLVVLPQAVKMNAERTGANQHKEMWILKSDVLEFPYRDHRANGPPQRAGAA